MCVCVYVCVCVCACVCVCGEYVCIEHVYLNLSVLAFERVCTSMQHNAKTFFYFYFD